VSKLKKLNAVPAVCNIINVTSKISHKGAELTKKKIKIENSVFSFVPLCLCVRSFWINLLQRVICCKVLVSLTLILFLSCASAPKISSPTDENPLSLLPAGARVYLWADTVKARPLLDVLSFQGVNGKDAAQVLDNTKTAAAAFFSDDGIGDITDNRQFYIAALGDYPRFSASLSFAFSRNWKKQKSSTGGSYWYSQADNIALALGNNLALVSNTDPLADFSAAASPEGFAAFSRGFALAGWMNDSAESINGFLAAMGIPLQLPAEDFFFGAEKNEAQGSTSALWDLVFKIRTPSAAQARSLLTLFSITRLFVLRAPDTAAAGEPMSPQQAAALLFANAPELDAEYLTLRMDTLEADKIALLFTMFSIYSN
jgi:hypothetical protein